MRYEIYLAKGMQVEGPLTLDELEIMEKDGRIVDYHWIWDVANNEWKPLQDPPPPPVQLSTQEEEQTVSATKKMTRGHSQGKNLSAVCYNFRNAVKGTLFNVGDDGAELICTSKYPPPFGTHSSVLIYVLNDRSKKGVSLRASLVRILKTANGDWKCMVRWRDALVLP